MTVIAVVNLKGGVGKTTTAVTLAALAARDGDTLLVDADPQASAAEWLEEAPIDGVALAEAPSERLVSRAVELGEGATVIIDTPPQSERIVAAAIRAADLIVIPTRVGAVEVRRVRATLDLVPAGLPHGLVISAARTATTDYKDTVAGWREAGVAVWATVPERVAVARGSGQDLPMVSLIALEPVLAVAKEIH